MEVYGLSGKSGTGKSYHSTELCQLLEVQAIIDDGLFIYAGNIAAGRSAKKEATKVGAIKTALFEKDKHCLEVKLAIIEKNPDKILVIGTSDRMVKLIAERLGLPEPKRIIHIEDITSLAQRNEAEKHRKEHGTHVIPAPALQVKKQFSGYFLDPRRSFRDSAGKQPSEKTLVRPNYSYLGSFKISDKVISDIVTIAAESVEGISAVIWVASDNSDLGMYLRVVVLFAKDAKVKTAAIKLQEKVAEMISKMTAFNVLGTEIEIRGFK